MKAIWKFVIGDPRTVRETSVDMPRGAAVLSAQMQDGGLVAWAMVDPSELKTQTHVFRIIGTGHPMPDDISLFVYRGTVQDDPYVWHIYENRFL